MLRYEINDDIVSYEIHDDMPAPIRRNIRACLSSSKGGGECYFVDILMI